MQCILRFLSCIFLESRLLDILRVIIASLSLLCRALYCEFHSQARREVKEDHKSVEKLHIAFQFIRAADILLARHTCP